MKTRTKWLGVAGLLITLSVVIYVLSNVDQTVTDRDVRAIARLDVDDVCNARASFDDEIACVRAIQRELFDMSGPGCSGVSSEIRHEPMDLLERGHGCCFDRSRFIEKALIHYGYDIRHVATHKLNWFFPVGYLEPGIPSHALTEVETRRGWMAVDSLKPFAGVDVEGQVHDTVSLREISVDIEREKELFGRNIPGGIGPDYRIAYGLYSRHGRFYPPFVPIPDIDWSQFLYNVWRG